MIRGRYKTKEYSKLSDLGDDLIYNALSANLSEIDKQQLVSIFKDVISKYSHLFQNEIFYKLDSSNKNFLVLILPSVKRVYSKFFIDIPGILKNDQKRSFIFSGLFDLGEFLKTLSDKIIKNHNIFSDFENIDSKSELLNIIVDDYTISKLNIVLESNNINILYRESKINKLLE